MVYLIVACRCVLAGVFLLSAGEKLRAPSAFASAIAGFQLMPDRFTRFAAYGVLAVELTTAALLAFPATVLPGFLLAAGLLVVLTAAVTQAVYRGLNVPCPCFGVSAAPVGIRHIVRDVLLVAVAGFGVLGTLAASDAVRAHAEAGGVIVAFCAGAVVVLLVRFTDELASAFSL
ncbi:MauE/DoxX family redox-associated membrane protein [Catenulispora subtropica]|uniref:Methylamine utilisation protein MauE domain-containing protein n=1 Tax=Catenulispora subtropica TaxID=450798 RepID=A0ABP5C958_9ACTN